MPVLYLGPRLPHWSLKVSWAAWSLTGVNCQTIGGPCFVTFRATRWSNQTLHYLHLLESHCMDSWINILNDFHSQFFSFTILFLVSIQKCDDSFNKLLSQGDEIDGLGGDSWMFLLWAPDNSKHRTRSTSSRFPMCVLPASLYAFDGSTNLTLQSVTAQLCASFNKLCDEGLPIRDLPSLGSRTVAWSI